MGEEEEVMAVRNLVRRTSRNPVRRTSRNLANLTRNLVRRTRVVQRAVMLARKAAAVAGLAGLTHPSQAAPHLLQAETSVGRMKIRTGAVHTAVLGMPMLTSAMICGMTTASLQSWPSVRIVVPVRQLKTIVSILKSTMEGWPLQRIRQVLLPS
jgi:hypothetical protein